MVDRTYKLKPILVFADYFEPGYKAGGPVRTLKNIFESLYHSFDFFLITRDHDWGEDTPYDLPKMTWMRNRTHSVFYIPEDKLSYKIIKQQIEVIKPSVIYFNSFFSWHLSIKILIANYKSRSKIVVAPRGELSHGAMSSKRFRKLWYLATCNVINIYKNVFFHASSLLEAEEIARNVNCRNIIIAADLVDPREFKKKVGYIKHPNTLRLCLISRIDYKKNIEYAINFVNGLPLSDIIFDIYGPVDDSKYWEKCKQLLRRTDSGKQIAYKGILEPHDVRKVFSTYDFFFFPTLGENFGHVVFESISIGTPLIVSSTTFWNTYFKESGGSYIFDLGKEAELTDILTHCYEMDNEKYQKISDSAFDIAVKFANSRTLIEKTKKVFE